MNKDSQSDAAGASVDASNGKSLLNSAVRIVDAYIRGNQIPASEVPTMIQNVLTALSNLASGSAPATGHKPPVPIKKSIGDDFIICLEDGKKLTMLKRYLRSQYDMSPEDYRKKWDLPPDYPMVAPAYARLRSNFAKKIGLGRIPVGQTGAGRTRRKA
ncbi:MAG: MucR family transcriptional regulator [Alphaproteobacteria bacterium]|nr:MucR family transcriptional regulator [Alphaproteobacteria bacterium]